MKPALIMTFIIGMFFITASVVRADGFVINFYYNAASKSLTLNNSIKPLIRDQNADTSIVEFSKDETVGPYILKLYDANNIEFSTSQFDKKNGAFQLIIPYFSIAANLKVIEKSTGKELIVANLKEFMTCNGNGKCESGIGETNISCMEDCYGSSSSQQNVTTNNIFSIPQTSIPDNSMQNAAKKDDTQSLSIWQKISQFFSNLF